MGREKYHLNVAFTNDSSLRVALTAIELAEYDEYSVMEASEVRRFALSLWGAFFWREGTSKDRPAIVPNGFDDETWDREVQDWRATAKHLRDSADCLDKYLDKLEARQVK